MRKRLGGWKTGKHYGRRDSRGPTVITEVCLSETLDWIPGSADF